MAAAVLLAIVLICVIIFSGKELNSWLNDIERIIRGGDNNDENITDKH